MLFWGCFLKNSPKTQFAQMGSQGLAWERG